MYSKTSNLQTESAPAGFASAKLTTGSEKRKIATAAAATVALLLLLSGLQYLLPLATAVKIGADEDFELAKPVLSLNGYSLYSEVWDDQPPAYTFMISQALKHFSYSVRWPRLITYGFAVLLLGVVFALLGSRQGAAAASLAMLLVLASPGFLELSCSCMQEIPALAPVVASIAVLWAYRRGKRNLEEVLAGLLFAVGMQIKYIGIIYLPLILLLLWARNWQSATPLKNALASLAAFVASAAAGFISIDLLTGSPLLLQLQQSWSSHFAGSQSSEYGSPADHPFDWLVLLKNWDLTLPAFLGVYFLTPGAQTFLSASFAQLFGRTTCTRSTQQARDSADKNVRAPGSSVAVDENAFSALLLCWLILTLVVFGLHKPWWQYYYIHNAIPLCLCAAVGIVGLIRRSGVLPGSLSSPLFAPPYSSAPVTRFSLKKTWSCKRNRLPLIAFTLYTICAVPWMIGRVYLQETGIRNSPKIYTSLVLKEIERFKPLTKFIFTDQPVYSFHSRIPMPPNLAILSLKRFWTGDMTNARLVAELQEVRPGLILLANSSRELPYQDLLDREYRLVYQDSTDSLYAHRSIASKAKY